MMKLMTYYLLYKKSKCQQGLIHQECRLKLRENERRMDPNT